MTATPVALTQTQIDWLDGRGQNGSPFGLHASTLLFGTRIAAIESELGVTGDAGTFTADTIAEETAAAGVTIDGLKIKDSGIDASGLATGIGYLGLADNLAAAWTVKQGANNYLVFQTTNDKEQIKLHKPVMGVVTGTVAAPVNMAGAAHTLVLATAGAGQTKLLGNVVIVDANFTGGGSSAQNLVLPAAADLVGFPLWIVNVGGENVTINTSVATLDPGQGCTVVSDGTAWVAFSVAGST